MDRRNVLRLGLAAGAAFALGPLGEDIRGELFPDGPPPLDCSWPLDIRDKYRNLTWAESSRIRVYLDGELVGGVIAVAPRSGHVLKYRLVRDPKPGARRIDVHRKPCACPVDLSLPLEGTPEMCLPLEILEGNVDIVTL